MRKTELLEMINSKPEVPKFIKNINWEKFNTQKGILLNLLNSEILLSDVNNALEGIVNLLDALQDYAAHDLGIDEDVVLKALVLYRIEADGVEKSAAYNGSMSDGGASTMRCMAIAYEAGLRREVPYFLEPFIKKVNRETDPEYAKFLELKKKFE
jgi:hypothetical protein